MGFDFCAFDHSLDKLESYQLAHCSFFKPAQHRSTGASRDKAAFLPWCSLEAFKSGLARLVRGQL